MEVGLSDVCAAQFALRSVARETPLEHTSSLGRMAGNHLHLKLENLQKNGSFKIRGAYNAIRLLSKEQRDRGIVTFSAGNWSQGVAYACRLLGRRATVVMPEGAPLSKVSATKGYGAEVIQHGRDSTELWERASALQRERGLTFLHAFDNPAMIAGHGTVALEILQQKPDVDAIVVPVGGGGCRRGSASPPRL